jgi:hypothetical protein
MAAEIVLIDPQDFSSQNYEGQDINLISTFEINTFLSTSSYVELFVYDNNQNILSSNYNFTQYTVLNNGQSPGSNNDLFQIEINPENTLIYEGYDQGQYNVYYNFFNKQIGSELQKLYISEISSDRTEIRLNSTDLNNIDIIEQTNNFVQLRENSPYFLDFYLNFGENQLAIANNIQLDNQDPTNPTILIKLYEALPSEFDQNSLLWVVTLLEEPIAYQVTFQDIPIIIADTVPLNGPNFNIAIKDQINNSTVDYNYVDLTSTSLTSSFNQLSSLLEEKEIDINIDYTNFNNFVHFSSAQVRLENFYYKISLLEDYSSSIAILNNTTNNNPSASLAVYENKINNVITNFDNYEYYLYYSSGSWTWPKINPQIPYNLYPINSPEVLNWLGSTNEYSPYYGGIILSASNFDNGNPNNLYYSIPEYLRDDPSNNQYQKFVEMVGQFYDNIWVYYKDVTEKYNADNRLEYGISKDIVADAIRDFGVKLYQNNFSINDLYTAFIGLTPQGGLFPFPNITGSLPTPTGFEYVDTLISASNDYIPLDDVNKSLYKRIYHNLPYLLKAKGTLPGLRTLITSYGIPDTVLRINEYGGKDKSNTNDWDYWENNFNYTFYTTASNFISTPWTPINTSWDTIDGVADSVSFRFKTDGLPFDSASIAHQSLWNVNGTNLHLVLRYEGTGYNTNFPTPNNPLGLPYSGSIIDPYYQYAYLDFYPSYNNDPTISASIYLPFYDGGWWSVMVNRSPEIAGNSDFTLYAGNKIYEGGDNGTALGFYATSSVNANTIEWTGPGTSYFARGGITINNNPYTWFSGSLQEIRYFTSPLSESVFKDYIMNPHSTEGNSLNSSPDELIFRASLGGELYTGSVSIHPKVTGSWVATSSFTLNSNFGFDKTPVFIPNKEYFFYDQPAVGIKNAVSDKIRIEDNIYPSGSTLSPFRSLAQNLAISQSYTANTNLLEVAFSPQDEINQDIMDQIGYFNIGEFIGDPRLRSSSATSYPALDNLRNEYFEKYIKNYDLNDYIRLIKFFDNSLFKMIKDFVPARTSLASGVVIKQHLLERNKYPQPQVNSYSTIAYQTSGSNPPSGSGSTNNIPFTFQDISVSGTITPQWNDYNPGTIENFSGGTGGTFEMFNGVSTSPYGPNGTGPLNIFFITQSWNEGIVTPLGIANTLHDAQDEFYDGEFSGSVLTVNTQSLHQPYPLNNIASYYRQVHYYGTGSDESNIFESLFLNNTTAPQNGEILFYNEPAILFGVPSYQLFNTKYLKIARIDCSGSNNTNVLENIDKALIFNDIAGQYVEYELTVLNEQTTYYLYEAIPRSYTPSLWPNQILNYRVSASNISPQTIAPGIFPTTLTLWGSVSGNTLNYFNPSTGIHNLGNTPNTQLLVTGSAVISGSSGRLYLNLQRQGNTSTLTSATYTSETPVTISSTYYGLQGDSLYLAATRGGVSGITVVKSGSFLLTQSRAISSSNCAPVIFEPYVTTFDYYYSDNNPTMNNINEERLSSLFEKVEYYPGITTPTNFALIISGSAAKAPVQDSNYTSKRVINPRYNGVKSTSQLLNQWTPGDTGTYGKTPTAQSLKTAVAYCDWIGGWPPDRENASAIHIQYLIKSDGTIVIPDVSENSLFENKGNFESGERLIISSKTISSGQPTQYRNIIRGGSRIEPILYTQFGQSPNISWNTTMSFANFTPSPISASADYQALLWKPFDPATYPSTGAINAILFTNVIYGSSYFNAGGYQVPLGAVQDNVSLTFSGKARLQFAQLNPFNAFGNINYTVRLYIYKNGSIISYSNAITQNFNPNLTYDFNINYTVLSNLSAGDIYTLAVQVTDFVPFVNGSYKLIGCQLKISQNPIYIPPTPITTGVNSIWAYYDSSSYPYVITSSVPELVQLYGNPDTKMDDIVGSGFNPILLPWSIEYGDEFRFEGREELVYQVGKIFGPAEGSGSGRLTQTGSIEVHFNYNLPVSASSSNFNLDHFVIRRYIDDPAQVLMEGFAPINSQGPYIVRPEYVVPELDKSVDEFILDLTQKGLL